MNKTSPPTWYWVVAVIALIWNIMGVVAYLGQVMMTEETLAALPEAQQALYENVPIWATSAFAIAVWSGLLGCIFLLLRRSLAVTLFIISLIAILVQDIYSFFVGKSFEVMGPSAVIMPVIVLAFGLYLIYFSRNARSKGWLR